MKFNKLTFDDAVKIVKANPTKYVLRLNSWTKDCIASCNVADNYKLYIETRYSTSKLYVNNKERHQRNWSVIAV